MAPNGSEREPTTKARSPTIVPSVLLHNATPNYPAVARESGREAIVLLVVEVDANGRVVGARAVAKRLGLGFEEAAILAARRSQWRPATKDGVRVPMEATLGVMEATLGVRFKLAKK